MPRQGCIRRRFGALLFVLASAAPVSAIDLSGVYVTQIPLLSGQCTLTFGQTGSALTINGPCTGFGVTSQAAFAGTVDEMTGEFTTTGELLCDPVTLAGTGDGETFTGTATCGVNVYVITGTKCGNGVIDSTESCEDGNTAAGDCCSPVCLLDAAGAACDADTTACTLDQCDGAGLCEHLPDPGLNGTVCEGDGNVCTDDVCNGAGQCLHPENSAPCEDGNGCTDPDVCAANACTSGPLVPQCAGSIDLTGDWVVSGPGGAPFAPDTSTHTFQQDGAVLESNLSGNAVGMGQVNPATGEFTAYSPFVIVFVFPCVEIISATASADSRTFSGQRSLDCGFEGFYGPFDVTGQRCDPGNGCACTVGVPCAVSDDRSRVTMRAKGGSVETRWHWQHTPLSTTFENPTAVTDYQVCLEVAGGGFVELAPHGSNWRTARSGFLYASRSSALRRLLLRSTSTKAYFAATLVSEPGPTLPLGTPVRLRLVQRSSTGAACYETEFANPVLNTPTRFRANE